MRCDRSGVVMLDSIEHIDEAYYPDKTHTGLAASGSRTELVKTLSEDTIRRVEQFRSQIAGKHWLDFGTGAGAILDELAGDAAAISAIEPQGEFQALLRSSGYTVHSNIRDVAPASIDIVTLFHVFEHLPDPLADLEATKRTLCPGGHVVIEVPHANDALLTRFDSDAFARFTMWGEHLLLHTKASLTTFLEAAGFVDIEVEGFQRYPLANTLHWLANGKPGGHQVWADLRDDELDERYSSLLDSLNMTDTLIATATAPIE